MNIEEMVEMLHLTKADAKRATEYWHKAEKSELRYCKEHDREFYDFEFEGMCPICYEDKLWWDFEHGDQEAGDILRRSGRLGKSNNLL